MATVILRVGSPLSFSDSIIVVLPLVCSSSALSIYIPSALPPYVASMMETAESVTQSVIKLQRLSDRQTDRREQLKLFLSAG